MTRSKRPAPKSTQVALRRPQKSAHDPQQVSTTEWKQTTTSTTTSKTVSRGKYTKTSIIRTHTEHHSYHRRGIDDDDSSATSKQVARIPGPASSALIVVDDSSDDDVANDHCQSRTIHQSTEETIMTEVCGNKRTSTKNTTSTYKEESRCSTVRANPKEAIEISDDTDQESVACSPTRRAHRTVEFRESNKGLNWVRKRKATPRRSKSRSLSVGRPSKRNRANHVHANHLDLPTPMVEEPCSPTKAHEVQRADDVPSEMQDVVVTVLDSDEEFSEHQQQQHVDQSEAPFCDNTAASAEDNFPEHQAPQGTTNRPLDCQSEESIHMTSQDAPADDVESHMTDAQLMQSFAQDEDEYQNSLQWHGCHDELPAGYHHQQGDAPHHLGQDLNSAQYLDTINSNGELRHNAVEATFLCKNEDFHDDNRTSLAPTTFTEKTNTIKDSSYTIDSVRDTVARFEDIETLAGGYEPAAREENVEQDHREEHRSVGNIDDAMETRVALNCQERIGASVGEGKDAVESRGGEQLLAQQNHISDTLTSNLAKVHEELAAMPGGGDGSSLAMEARQNTESVFTSSSIEQLSDTTSLPSQVEQLNASDVLFSQDMFTIPSIAALPFAQVDDQPQDEISEVQLSQEIFKTPQAESFPFAQVEDQVRSNGVSVDEDQVRSNGVSVDEDTPTA
ncbi:unnamed protein product [Sympodiomycopsis kandeliae]